MHLWTHKLSIVGRLNEQNITCAFFVVRSTAALEKWGAQCLTSTPSTVFLCLQYAHNQSCIHVAITIQIHRTELLFNEPLIDVLIIRILPPLFVRFFSERRRRRMIIRRVGGRRFGFGGVGRLILFGTRLDIEGGRKCGARMFRKAFHDERSQIHTYRSILR